MPILVFVFVCVSVFRFFFVIVSVVVFSCIFMVCCGLQMCKLCFAANKYTCKLHNIACTVAKHNTSEADKDFFLGFGLGVSVGRHHVFGVKDNPPWHASSSLCSRSLALPLCFFICKRRHKEAKLKVGFKRMKTRVSLRMCVQVCRAINCCVVL
jgi:hypothetical protein